MQSVSSSSEDLVPVQFTPALWEQRISKVKEIIVKHKIKEICDLGCGSGSLLSELVYYKGIKLLIGVDIDQNSLSDAIDKCIPGIPAYICKRKYPLEVKLIKGSITEPCDQIPFQIPCVTLCEV